MCQSFFSSSRMVSRCPLTSTTDQQEQQASKHPRARAVPLLSGLCSPLAFDGALGEAGVLAADVGLGRLCVLTSVRGEMRRGGSVRVVSEIRG